MPILPERRKDISEMLYQMNGGRGFLGNLLGLFCAACVLGLANLIAHSFFKVELSWLLDILLLGEALYFFVPYLLLKFVFRQPLSRF